MDSNQLNAVITVVIMAAITPVMSSVVKLMEKFMPVAYKKLKDGFNRVIYGKKYSVEIKRNLNYSPKRGWVSEWSSNENQYLITSILEFVTENKLVATSSRCNISEPIDGIKDQLERMQTRKATYAPTEIIKYQNIELRYYEYEEDLSEGCKSKIIELVVSSRKSMETIDEFINKCYKLHVTKKYGANVDKRYMISQVRSDRGNRFKKYLINNKASFDSVFFTEKETLLNLLDKLSSGKLHKIGLLLHGLPGCGKTSIIKSIAKCTNRHVINVKLSLVKNDADLMDIFHNSSYMCYKNNDESCDQYAESIPANQRIYILEDVDAECEAILERSTKSDTNLKSVIESSPTTDKSDKLTKIDKPAGVTLSGILNVLDGVLELDESIVIMTTNYVDKLDSALIRPGRITMSIELGKMLSTVANQMVYKYYNTCIDNIQDNLFTPATLESLIQQSTDIDHLKQLIDRYQSK